MIGGAVLCEIPGSSSWYPSDTLSFFLCEVAWGLLTLATEHKADCLVPSYIVLQYSFLQNLCESLGLSYYINSMLYPS